MYRFGRILSLNKIASCSLPEAAVFSSTLSTTKSSTNGPLRTHLRSCQLLQCADEPRRSPRGSVRIDGSERHGCAPVIYWNTRYRYPVPYFPALCQDSAVLCTLYHLVCELGSTLGPSSLNMPASSKFDPGYTYEVCSLSTSNETEDDIPGAGRVLGKLYNFLGQKVESGLSGAAEQMGYGPNAIALRIQRIQENQGLDLRRRRKLRSNCKRLVRYVR